VAENFSFPVSPGARYYAEALFAAAEQAGCLDETAKFMASLAAIIEESADFRRFIACPLYKAAAQERVIAALLQQAGLAAGEKTAGTAARARQTLQQADPAAGGKTEERFAGGDEELRPAGSAANEGAGLCLRRFFAVVARHRRLPLLPDICAAFQARCAAARGEVAVFITMAEAVSAPQKQEILALLARAAAENSLAGQYLAGKNPVVHERVDPAVLGGFIVRCGSLLIDTSLRAKLSALKLALKEVG